MLQLAHNYGIFETVLNKSLATDLETGEAVIMNSGDLTTAIW